MSSYNEVLAEHRYLESERLHLRPAHLDDAPALFAMSQSAEFLRYMTWSADRDLAGAERRLASYYIGAPLGKYAVELKATGACIGFVDLHFFDEVARSAEIGYLLNPEFQGHCYVTEACKCLLALGFEVLDLVRISARCDVRNEASLAVMERIGMQREALMRRQEFCKDEFCDMLHYSILDTDYFG
ncbi:GNAT family N-acetyltransferase [Culicoidibacter larvae]|uniref:GNAT family N-acetyltransferase n=1 Tax=Culicoidibacter larvae TaxID=2579976 RepID=A0A5R8QI75_9FIRM|nr:GNAT family protein [Culicoidibacter larvae]TLG77390.1 GNAT family N-acetyltransferase [Culicoidibacter larvae]